MLCVFFAAPLTTPPPREYLSEKGCTGISGLVPLGLGVARSRLADEDGVTFVGCFSVWPAAAAVAVVAVVVVVVVARSSAAIGVFFFFFFDLFPVPLLILLLLCCCCC